jgi:hypothetical protein
MDGPVDADDVGAERADRLEPRAAALGEDDLRHAPAVGSRLSCASTRST